MDQISPPPTGRRVFHYGVPAMARMSDAAHAEHLALTIKRYWARKGVSVDVTAFPEGAGGKVVHVVRSNLVNGKPAQ